MRFASLAELVQGGAAVFSLEPGAFAVKDEEALRSVLVDRLVQTVVFGDGQTREAARWLIWEAAWQLGIQSASTDPLYRAWDQGTGGHLVVPSISVPVLAFDSAWAIFSSAKRSQVRAVIFDLPLDEMAWTGQSFAELATAVTAAAIKAGHVGPYYLQCSRCEVDVQERGSDPTRDLVKLQRQIREAVVAGYRSIGLAAMVTGEEGPPPHDRGVHETFGRCAELAAYVRELEPDGVTVAIGLEVDRPSAGAASPAELRSCAEDFSRAFVRSTGAQERGLAAIGLSRQTYGAGAPRPNGSTAGAAADHRALRGCAEVAQSLGLATIVRATAPEDVGREVAQIEGAVVLETHLTDTIQNVILQGEALPGALQREMQRRLMVAKAGARVRNGGETRGWGGLKEQLWWLPDQTRAEIRAEIEARLGQVFRELGASGSGEMT